MLRPSSLKIMLFLVLITIFGVLTIQQLHWQCGWWLSQAWALPHSHWPLRSLCLGFYKKPDTYHPLPELHLTNTYKGFLYAVSLLVSLKDAKLVFFKTSSIVQKVNLKWEKRTKFCCGVPNSVTNDWIMNFTLLLLHWLGEGELYIAYYGYYYYLLQFTCNTNQGQSLLTDCSQLLHFCLSSEPRTFLLGYFFYHSFSDFSKSSSLVFGTSPTDRSQIRRSLH